MTRLRRFVASSPKWRLAEPSVQDAWPGLARSDIDALLDAVEHSLAQRAAIAAALAQALGPSWS
jgi:hypothetical protein